ncbi:MAG: glycosyltransferase family 9 protein [Phototrophicaceae bacterium]
MPRHPVVYRRQPPLKPRRVICILPCCIGDVVMSTAALTAIRRRYPQAHITYAVGQWSRPVLEGHPAIDALLDLADTADPVATAADFWRFVRTMREGQYDLAVSWVRSWRMGAALWAAGIPYRAGLDSAGRGFGYNIRAPILPHEARHEVEIFLDVAAALGADADTVYPNVYIHNEMTSDMMRFLTDRRIVGRFIVVNPSGGQNPGANMPSKQYPPAKLAALINRLTSLLNISHVVVVTGPGDGRLSGELALRVHPAEVTSFVGELTFPQIGALAQLARVYIGNDTGLTHYAAATGATTVMILGPTDPKRYAPYSPGALAVWKPSPVKAEGASAGVPEGWNWNDHGIDPLEAAGQIANYVGNSGFFRIE